MNPSDSPAAFDQELLIALNGDYIDSVQTGDAARFDTILAEDFIHARTTFITAIGEQRIGRYTDVWARRKGRWLAVSAHVTR